MLNILYKYYAEHTIKGLGEIGVYKSTYSLFFKALDSIKENINRLVAVDLLVMNLRCCGIILRTKKDVMLTTSILSMRFSSALIINIIHLFENSALSPNFNIDFL